MDLSINIVMNIKVTSSVGAYMPPSINIFMLISIGITLRFDGEFECGLSITKISLSEIEFPSKELPFIFM